MVTVENDSERLENLGTELFFVEDKIDCVTDWDNCGEYQRNEAPGDEEYSSVWTNFPVLESGFDFRKIHWAEEAFQDQLPIDWIVEKLFSAGSVSVLYGDPGSKKTYAMIDCAVCVVLGKLWLGFTTEKSTVLIIDEECGLRRLNRRIRQTVRGHTELEKMLLAYISIAQFDLQKEKDLLILEGKIKEIGAKFVIIDAFVDIMPGGDENSSQAVHPVFRGLRYIADKYQLAIVVIHHANRNGGIRGSSAISGAVDMEMKITSPKNSDTIKFETIKTRDVAPFSFSAKANLQDDKFWLSNGDEAEGDKPLNVSKKVVIKFLANNGQSSVKDISGTSEKLKPDTARSELNKLRKLGYTNRVDSEVNGKKAIWDLTEEGKQLARDEGFLDHSSEEPPW